MGAIVDAVNARLRRAERNLPRSVRLEVREAAPVKTGELARSITATATLRGPVLTVTVGSDLVQAATTNSGARPHTIRPRRARALRFTVRGRVVYAKSVRHPGNRGTHWFDRAVEKWPDMVRYEITRP